MADDRLPILLANLPPSSHYSSLEFFPPKTASGFSNLHARLARMATALRPLFVTVTWGAGGSTAARSLELAELCQRQLGITTVLHLTCTNMKKKALDDALEAAKEVGVRNILALRGDPPRDEYKDADDTSGPEQGSEAEDFVWAVDLVRYIRRKHGDYFAIGVAGYPEGHADESNPVANKQSVEHDLPYLAEKVAAGADFIMTQLTFDIAAYRTYEKKLRAYVDKDGKRLLEKIPIMPGLMPIQSYAIIKRISKLSHATIPDDISKRIEAVKSDDEAVKKVGVDILSELVEQMKTLPQPDGVPQVLHFYTLNLERSVALVVERTGLIPPASEASPIDSSDSEVMVDDKPRFSRRRASSVNAQPHNRVIIDRSSRSPKQSKRPLDPDTDPPGQLPSLVLTQHEADDRGTGIPATAPTREHNLAISKGQGALGREATYDDFPNGRWGISSSPAYGEIDGWGPTLKISPMSARKLWGNPKSPQDITDIFRRHVQGELEAVPWSDEIDLDNIGAGVPGGALRPETTVINTELLTLIAEHGYWTLASQPAVDGAPSDDPVVGWGPPGEGFVFQKAFVEFFVLSETWEQRLKPLLTAHAKDIAWMKTTADGVFEAAANSTSSTQQPQQPSQSTSSTSTRPVNSVTWGVFRNREILAPTIIEEESFRAWAEEAYALWREWARCFPRGSNEEQFLEQLRRAVVLVNCVGHQFRGGHEGGGGQLWRILLGKEEKGLTEL